MILTIAIPVAFSAWLTRKIFASDKENEVDQEPVIEEPAPVIEKPVPVIEEPEPEIEEPKPAPAPRAAALEQPTPRVTRRFTEKTKTKWPALPITPKIS